MTFTIDQVLALCGGAFPHAGGFDWKRVQHFLMVEGALVAVDGFGAFIPAPSISVSVALLPQFAD